MDVPDLKPVHWIGPTRRELRQFPETVRDAIGFATGVATPKHELELIRARLKEAERRHEEYLTRGRAP